MLPFFEEKKTVLRPEKGIKKVKTKIFVFKYFPTILSEMNSMHPFYPIVPNTSYVEKKYLLHGGPKNLFIKINDIQKIISGIGFVKRYF